MWKNKITVLQHRAFSGLRRLSKLDLQRNAIENLAHGTFTDSVVLSIDLSWNKLTNIQVDQLTVTGLKRLSLSHNVITLLVARCFPDTLEELDLSDNILEEIQPSILSNLKDLVKLNLSENKLKIITPTVSLPSLAVLDVSHNIVAGINRGSFSDFPELKELRLGYNNISYLSPHIFSENASPLNVLELHRNKLVSLDYDLGRVLSDSAEVTLGGNPWSCSCLWEIRNYFNDRHITQPKCDDNYLASGTAAVCVVMNITTCTGNEVLTDALLKEFETSLQYYRC